MKALKGYAGPGLRCCLLPGCEESLLRVASGCGGGRPGHLRKDRLQDPPDRLLCLDLPLLLLDAAQSGAQLQRVVVPGLLLKGLDLAVEEPRSTPWLQECRGHMNACLDLDRRSRVFQGSFWGGGKAHVSGKDDPLTL